MHKKRLYLVFLVIARDKPIISSDEIIEIDWFTYPVIQNMYKNNLLQTGFEIDALKLMFSSTI